MATKGDISTLDVLMFGNKPMIPLVSGFTRAKSSGVIRDGVSVGSTRQRRKYYGTPHTCSVTFRLESDHQKDFMRNFIERNEGRYFIVHMEADRPLIEPYVVQAIDEWSESSIDIEGSGISTTFEVVSVRDRDLDNAIFPLYQFYGHDLGYAVSLYYDLTKWMPV